MLQVFLLGPLLLVHQKLHRWIRKFPVEENAKEVLSVLVWVLAVFIRTFEDINQQGSQRCPLEVQAINLIRRGTESDLLFVLFESLVLLPFGLLLLFGDYLGAPMRVCQSRRRGINACIPD